MSGTLSYPDPKEELPSVISAGPTDQIRPSKRHTSSVCPDCGGKKIRRSRPRGFLESMILPLFYRPFRCEECDRRFFRPTQNFSFLRSLKNRHSAH